MYKIGELSRLCRLPVKTLRYYDSEGLLTPDEIDRFTGYRYYSAAKLTDCYRIIALKELGFSLEEIKRQMRARDTGELLSLIAAKRSALEEILRRTDMQLQQLNAIETLIKEEKAHMFNLIIQKNESIRTAALRKIYSTKEEALKEMKKIEADLPPRLLGKRRVIINYETEYRENNFDLAACVEITGDLPLNSGCGYSEKIIVPAAEMAGIVCSQEKLDAGYRFMTGELKRRACQITGAYIEIYHGDGTVELKVPVHRLSKHEVFVSDTADLPFENDPEAVGRWELLDIVPSREQFLYGHKKCEYSAWLHELYFLENGEPYWTIGGWTKGFVYTLDRSPQYLLKNSYTIERQDGHTLLFLERRSFKDGNDWLNSMPEIWVYEKRSDAACHASDIKRRDFTDYPFISDPKIVGAWTVRDFYACDIAEAFDPNKQNFPEEELFLLKLECLPDGTCIQTTQSHESRLLWTKGFLLDQAAETAQAYELKVIDGKEYLIVEWKSGDYQFGGGRICWYVLVRA